MESRQQSLWAIILIFIAGFVAVFAIWRIMFEINSPLSSSGTSQVNVSPTEQSTDSVRQILGNPDDYYGKTVSIEGKIYDVKGNRAFLVGDATSNDQLPAITREALSEEQLNESREVFTDDAAVLVTGIVQVYEHGTTTRQYRVEPSEEIREPFSYSTVILVVDRITFGDNNLTLNFKSQGTNE